MLKRGDSIFTVRRKLALRELVPNRLQLRRRVARAERDLGRRSIGIAAKSRDRTALAVQVMPSAPRTTDICAAGSTAGLPLQCSSATLPRRSRCPPMRGACSMN